MVDDDSDPINEKLINFVLFIDCDPSSYEKVVQNDCWLKVMNEEIHTIEKNNI